MLSKWAANTKVVIELNQADAAHVEVSSTSRPFKAWTLCHGHCHWTHARKGLKPLPGMWAMDRASQK